MGKNLHPFTGNLKMSEKFSSGTKKNQTNKIKGTKSVHANDYSQALKQAITNASTFSCSFKCTVLVQHTYNVLNSIQNLVIEHEI